MVKNKDPVKKLDFNVKPVGIDSFYGIELDGDHQYMTSDGIVHHNSGKSVMEQAIVGHVSRYPDHFQLVGVDCKRVNNFAHAY